MTLLGEQVAWSADGKTLRVLDDNTAERLGRRYLSASTSKAMHEKSCAARWVANRLLPDVADPFAANSLGTAAHEVLETMFGLPPEERTPKNAGKILDDIVAREWQKDPSKGPEWRAQVRSAMGQYFASEDPTSINLFQTEWRIDGVDVYGIPFKGFVDRIDRIVVDGVEGLEVVDYKSSNKIPTLRYGDDHGDQIRLYKAAIEQSGKTRLPVLRGRLIYTRHGKNRDVPLTANAMKATEKDFKHSWERYLRLNAERAYPVGTGPLCGWCPLVNACPLAHAEGREAKIVVPTLDVLGMSVEHRVENLVGCGTVIPLDVSVPKQTASTVPVIPDWGGEQTAPHVHLDSDLPVTKQKETKMTDYREAKPYEREGKGYDPDNPRPVDWNSYGATAVVGMSTLSQEILERDGFEIEGNGSLVMSFAWVLAKVIQNVQVAVTGEGIELPLNWEYGINTRFRGIVRTVMESKQSPIPWGGDAEAWENWIFKASKRLSASMMVAKKLYTEPVPEEPYAALVGVLPTNPKAADNEVPAAKPAPVKRQTAAEKKAAAEAAKAAAAAEEAAAEPEAEPEAEVAPEPEAEPEVQAPTPRVLKIAKPVEEDATPAPVADPEPEVAPEPEPVKAAIKNPNLPPPIDFDDDYYDDAN